MKLINYHLPWLLSLEYKCKLNCQNLTTLATHWGYRFIGILQEWMFSARHHQQSWMMVYKSADHMFQDYGKLFLLFVEVYWNDHIYVYHLPYQEKQTQLRVFEFQVPSLIWPFHMQVKSDRKGPQINNPMSLPRLRKCFFLFLFFALVKQFLPNVQVFYLGLSFGLSPVTLKYRIIFIQLIVNGPEPSYNSIILKGKN